MSSDTPRWLRRIKPEKRRGPLSPRPVADLLNVSDVAEQGPLALVLDTNFYIRLAADKLPEIAMALVDRATLFNCSVCVAELATGIANADPAHPRTPAMRRHYTEVIDQMNADRRLVPSLDVWGEAGLISGTLARTQNYQKHQRLACLNDALILLSAAKAGLPVLTENRKDFDLIQQLAPHTRFIWF